MGLGRATSPCIEMGMNELDMRLQGHSVAVTHEFCHAGGFRSLFVLIYSLILTRSQPAGWAVSLARHMGDSSQVMGGCLYSANHRADVTPAGAGD
jgi:hypothetical protein